MAKPLKFYQTLNQQPKGPRHGKHRRASPTTHGYSVGEPSDSAGGSDQDGTVTFNISNWTVLSWDIATPEPPKPPAVPYAGIRTGEIVGHRLWWVIGGRLCSLAHRRLWQPDEIVYGDTLVPVAGMSGLVHRIFGGTYAYARAEQLLPEIAWIQNEISDRARLLERGIINWSFHWDGLNETDVFVRGTIKMWGDVIEHEHGYRAEFAKLNSIDEMFGPGDIDALRAKYLPLNIHNRETP